MSDAHFWIGTERVENRLRIMASRSNLDKLRDGGRTHRGRPGFRKDSTAPSPASGGDGFSSLRDSRSGFADSKS